MNRRAFVAGTAFSVLALAAEQRLSAQTASGAEQEVRKAENDRFAAMLKADTAALERLLAADLVYTHGDGRVVDKAVFIAEAKTGDFKYVSIDAGDLKVRVYGDTAIVTGSAGMQVVNKGAPAKIRIVYTNVHVRRGGAWQMVTWQATRLAQ
jgi:ketosteroid isomerase-like protein